jgi:hypothetical protein
MSNSISTGVAYKDPEFSDVVVTGDLSVAGTFTLGGNVLTPAELAALDGVTAGTVTANKAVIVDANKDIGTFGAVTGATFTGGFTSNSSSGLLVGNAAGGVYFLSTAITANSTATTVPAGSLGLTSNATGVGKLFVSDGALWQVASITP